MRRRGGWCVAAAVVLVASCTNTPDDAAPTSSTSPASTTPLASVPLPIPPTVTVVSHRSDVPIVGANARVYLAPATETARATNALDLINTYGGVAEWRYLDLDETTAEYRAAYPWITTPEATLRTQASPSFELRYSGDPPWQLFDHLRLINEVTAIYVTVPCPATAGSLYPRVGNTLGYPTTGRRMTFGNAPSTVQTTGDDARKITVTATFGANDFGLGVVVARSSPVRFPLGVEDPGGTLDGPCEGQVVGGQGDTVGVLRTSTVTTALVGRVSMDQIGTMLASITSGAAADFGQHAPDLTGSRISPMGIGPLEIGLTYAELSARGFDSHGDTCDRSYFVEPVGRIELSLATDVDAIAVMNRYGLRPKSFATGMGLTRDEVIAQWGQPGEARPSPYQESPPTREQLRYGTSLDDPDTPELRFELTDGIVSFVKAGLPSAFDQFSCGD